MPKLRVDLEADSSKFESKLSQLSSKMKNTFSQKFGNNIGSGTGGNIIEGKGLGMLGIAGIGSAFAVVGKAALNLASRINDLSVAEKTRIFDLNTRAREGGYRQYRKDLSSEFIPGNIIGAKPLSDVESFERYERNKRIWSVLDDTKKPRPSVRLLGKMGIGESNILNKPIGPLALARSMGIGGGLLASGGAAAVGLAVGKLVSSTIAYSDKLQDLSEQTGITVQDIDAMGKSAEGGGKTAEDAIKMMTELQTSRVEALGGNKTAMAGFEKLGISLDQLSSTKNIAQLMGGANIQGAEQRKALSDVVGKRNVGTFAVMQQDLADWDNFKQKLSDSGRLVDPASVANVAEFKDAMREIGQAITSTILPGLSTALKGITNLWYWVYDTFEFISAGFGPILGKLGGEFMDTFKLLYKLAGGSNKSINNIWDEYQQSIMKRENATKEFNVWDSGGAAKAQARIEERATDRIRKRQLALEQNNQTAGQTTPETADEINARRQKNMDEAIKDLDTKKPSNKVGDELQKFLFGNKERTLSGLAGVAAGTNLQRLSMPMNDSVSILKMIERNTRDE